MKKPRNHAKYVLHDASTYSSVLMKKNIHLYQEVVTMMLCDLAAATLLLDIP
jgi:hypothetical protein